MAGHSNRFWRSGDQWRWCPVFLLFWFHLKYVPVGLKMHTCCLQKYEMFPQNLKHRRCFNKHWRCFNKHWRCLYKHRRCFNNHRRCFKFWSYVPAFSKPIEDVFTAAFPVFWKNKRNQKGCLSEVFRGNSAMRTNYYVNIFGKFSLRRNVDIHLTSRIVYHIV